MAKVKDTVNDLKIILDEFIDKHYTSFSRQEIEKILLHRDLLLKKLREKLG